MELNAHSIRELHLFHIVYILLLIQRTNHSFNLNYMAKCVEEDGMHIKTRRTRNERVNERMRGIEIEITTR